MSNIHPVDDKGGPLNKSAVGATGTSPAGAEASDSGDAGSHFIQQMMAFSGPMPHPLAQKITTEHIDKVLDYGNKQSERADSQLTKSKYLTFGGLLLAVVVILALVGLLKDQPALLMPVLSGVVGLFAGFFAGLGVGKSQK